jgi:hypothetical protein
VNTLPQRLQAHGERLFRDRCVVPGCNGQLKASTLDGYLVEWCVRCAERLILLRTFQRMTAAAPIADLESALVAAERNQQLADARLSALAAENASLRHELLKALKTVERARSRGELSDSGPTEAILRHLPPDASAAFSVAEISARAAIDAHTTRALLRRMFARGKVCRRAGSAPQGMRKRRTWYYWLPSSMGCAA